MKAPKLKYQPPLNKSPLFQIPNTFRTFYGAFSGLYPVQQQAISPVLAEKDLMIQSATNSGKTEAVLAPCLERIIAADKSEAVLYIVPTRALAFDIRRRFANLIEERLGLHFAIRTGDVKTRGGGRPDLMLTTPESLDVMMGSGNADLRAFLLRVRIVIIDEVYPFLNEYRGRQLAFLLHRLERRIGRRLQKIALSATIADPDAVCRFFNFRPDYVLLTESVSREILPRLVHLKDDEVELVNLLDDLFHEWKYHKILIFANSRGRCDRIFGLLNQQGAFKGRILLHYSNLNAKERQAVEHEFRKQNSSVCVATSTLELGIDIGDVDAVLLFEPPDSVSAFLQRIGRANRREDTIQFWGICQGERAGEQLLRFLALLRLARKGRVETVPPRGLPSVLSQQFISCLYEKRRLSLTALQGLFPWCPQEATRKIFTALVQKNWLKKDPVNGLYKGGWQYWQAMLERRIWSNFPENEEQYQLLVASESVADIPRSIIRQIEPGDRVLLAGRRLRILWIDEGECKRVLAEPVRQLDHKELAWLGKGCHVSHEVARAMKAVLKSADAADNEAAPGLFSRSRELIRKELEKDRGAVVLDNGIEVIRTPDGSYQYRTFMGAVANLILALSIRDLLARRKEDIRVTSNEIGVTCSCQVRFEELSLPLTEADLTAWVTRHFKMVRAMFPMNAFCATLPRELICQELADFIRDERLLNFFNICRTKTSKIVSGDPASLDLHLPVAEKRVFPEIMSQSDSLLAWEKDRRWRFPCPEPGPHSTYQFRALTGTTMGEYFRHGQCERWLSLHFLRKENQPCRTTAEKDEIAAVRMAKGLEFEEKVISHLRQKNKISATIRAEDVKGRLRPVDRRFSETLSCLRQTAKQENIENTYIVRAVLRVDRLLTLPHMSLPGVGIPDLLQIRSGEETGWLSLQVGDIKSSARPRYYQKWQVAFYAWLLDQILEDRPELAPLSVADNGFLLIPSGRADLAQRHVFDLKPYFASIRAVLSQISAVLARPHQQAFWHLQKHCTHCGFFDYCYHQALKEEDIQFIPGLSRGSLAKMRRIGVKTLEQEIEWGDIFSPRQKRDLAGAINALRRNKIIIKAVSGRNRTFLFPANISTIFAVHLVIDPATGLFGDIGMAMQAKGRAMEVSTWSAATDSERRRAWKDFSRLLARRWHEAIEDGRGPHILLFGPSARQVILHWAALMDGREIKRLFSFGDDSHCTDLRQVLTAHFSLPIPGNITMWALNKTLALLPEARLPAPESLFHEDRFAEMDMALICSFIMQLGQWIFKHVRSSRHKDDWRCRQEPPGIADCCRQLIEAERQHRERDIAELRGLSLAERVERFRALGPLDFVSTALDDEGKFLYLFTPSQAHGREVHVQTRFRQGDFLRLTPIGISDPQSGIPVIMAGINTKTSEVALYPRQGNMGIASDMSYSLEEDGEDFLSKRLLDAVQRAFSSDNQQIIELLAGRLTHKKAFDEYWLQAWLDSEAAAARLNPSQIKALKLPFQYNVSLISGPPGTGKTTLLGWILIALIRQAQSRGMEMRIAVSALTHRAIDQVLKKVTRLVNSHDLDFPARCLKYGAWEGGKFDVENDMMQVGPCANAGEVLGCPYLILGATGYGLEKMLRAQEGAAGQKPFDWIIFDEASQLLLPQALPALIHGKENFLFLGDIRQLPPIIRSSVFTDADDTEPGAISGEIRCSVLEILLRRYPRQCRLLDVTFRMNDAICRFPSETWYGGLLHPAQDNVASRLVLRGPAQHDFLAKIIDPEKPVVLVETDHLGCGQKSMVEAELLAGIAGRLIKDHGIRPEDIAIISPHRAQNSAIGACLSGLLGHNELPVIDTVERMQGAEREVILFGFTCSDYDGIFSDFLNNSNRFNVILTRTRRKLIVVGSKIFFGSVAHTEEQLRANACFKNFFTYCRDNGWYVQDNKKSL